MSGKQSVDDLDDGLELHLKQLLDEIRKEPIPEEIRALARKLEAALKARENAESRRSAGDPIG
jgi:hypothetical protein